MGKGLADKPLMPVALDGSVCLCPTRMRSTEKSPGGRPLGAAFSGGSALALLVGDRAGCFASGLAGCLAFAAARLLDVLVERSARQCLDVFHDGTSHRQIACLFISLYSSVRVPASPASRRVPPCETAPAAQSAAMARGLPPDCVTSASRGLPPNRVPSTHHRPMPARRCGCGRPGACCACGCGCWPPPCPAPGASPPAPAGAWPV